VRSVTLAFLGDVMLGRGVSEEVGRHEPEWFWGDTLPLLRRADAVIANLECAITSHTRRWRPDEKVFHFRAPPGAVDVLKAGGVRCVSLANNHAFDFEAPGLLETVRLLDAGGIRHAGAGATLEEASAPAFFDAGGLRIGLVAFTDNEPDSAAGPGRPGVCYVDTADPVRAIGALEGSIDAARAAGADLVVLSAHWGPNMTTEPAPAFCEIAHAALQRGVHVVHGHSAHVFHGVETDAARLIMYDTGDFLDDYAVDHRLRNDRSFIFRVEAEPTAVRRLRMIPVVLPYARVRLANKDEGREIRARMLERCAPFGTRPAESPEGYLEVSCA
jgi:poly-gamma-glutamate synthesis protein (capsule biosynthesis protein)